MEKGILKIQNLESKKNELKELKKEITEQKKRLKWAFYHGYAVRSNLNRQLEKISEIQKKINELSSRLKEVRNEHNVIARELIAEGVIKQKIAPKEREPEPVEEKPAEDLTATICIDSRQELLKFIDNMLEALQKNPKAEKFILKYRKGQTGDCLDVAC